MRWITLALAYATSLLWAALAFAGTTTHDEKFMKEVKTLCELSSRLVGGNLDKHARGLLSNLENNNFEKTFGILTKVCVGATHDRYHTCLAGLLGAPGEHDKQRCRSRASEKIIEKWNRP